jgi:hypothetical protein
VFEAINWPEALAPSRSPIHFTNELEVEASPETIWSLLVDPLTWPTFYPGLNMSSCLTVMSRWASELDSKPTWPARTSSHPYGSSNL